MSPGEREEAEDTFRDCLQSAERIAQPWPALRLRAPLPWWLLKRIQFAREETPTRCYRYLHHQDNLIEHDTKSTLLFLELRHDALEAEHRVGYPLSLFWGEVGDLFMGEGYRDAICERLSIEPQALYPSAFLFEGQPGYYLKPHPDDPTKVASMVIYLDNGPLGTSLYRTRAPSSKEHEVPMVRNTAILFKRTDRSFHGVEPPLGEGRVRPVLLVNLYNTPHWRDSPTLHTKHPEGPRSPRVPPWKSYG